jgi:hypothetical protein
MRDMVAKAGDDPGLRSRRGSPCRSSDRPARHSRRRGWHCQPAVLLRPLPKCRPGRIESCPRSGQRRWPESFRQPVRRWSPAPRAPTVPAAHLRLQAWNRRAGRLPRPLGSLPASRLEPPLPRLERRDDAAAPNLRSRDSRPGVPREPPPTAATPSWEARLSLRRAPGRSAAGGRFRTFSVHRE